MTIRSQFLHSLFLLCYSNFAFFYMLMGVVQMFPNFCFVLKVAAPGPDVFAIGGNPISALISGRSTESSQGPFCDAPAIQIVTCAVVDPKRSQPCSMPCSRRNPLFDAAFRSSVRTTNPGGSSGTITFVSRSPVDPKQLGPVLPSGIHRIVGSRCS